MEFPEQTPTTRQTCLSVMMAGMVGVFLLFVLILITQGAIFYVLPVLGGITLFSWLHYLWWGRLMDQETAGEREEEELRRQAEKDGWPLPDPDRVERY